MFIYRWLLRVLIAGILEGYVYTKNYNTRVVKFHDRHRKN
jgi:hypothetical protein